MSSESRLRSRLCCGVTYHFVDLGVGAAVINAGKGRLAGLGGACGVGTTPWQRKTKRKQQQRLEIDQERRGECRQSLNQLVQEERSVIKSV